MKSIYNFLTNNFDAEICIYDKPCSQLDSSDVIFIPGVGHFGFASKYIYSNKLEESIYNFSESKKPIIGICLGAQLLTNSSEEDSMAKGLRLIDAECKSLLNHPTYKDKIPRIGWSGLKDNNQNAFYFVHSYYIDVNDANLKTSYSDDGVTAMIESDNILAMQFHPEKSDVSGVDITKSFITKHV
tara:strand:+ start:62 stop:616 length:555 start_codon:yes stop_codon:yes gene_type:complete